MNLDINLITQGSQDLIIGNTNNNPIIIVNNLITEQTLITQGSQEQIIGKTNNPIIPIHKLIKTYKEGNTLGNETGKINEAQVKDHQLIVNNKYK